MSREKILGEEDGVLEPETDSTVVEDNGIWNLRPKTINEYVGQQQVVESLQIAIGAAQVRSEPLDHVLFHGPPGLGKTTLAHIISKEMGSDIVHSSGPALEKPLDIVGILSNLNEGEVLFIDEIPVSYTHLTLPTKA